MFRGAAKITAIIIASIVSVAWFLFISPKGTSIVKDLFGNKVQMESAVISSIITVAVVLLSTFIVWFGTYFLFFRLFRR